MNAGGLELLGVDMVPLSIQMCNSLGLEHGTTVQQLIDHRVTSSDFLDGLLANEHARDEAELALRSRDHYDLHMLRQIGPPEQRYCAVNIDGHAEPALVGLVPSVPPAYLPTSLENLVFWGVVDPSFNWHSQWKETEGRQTNDWRRVAAGHAILATPIGMPTEGLRLLCGLFNLDHVDLATSAPAPPLVSHAAVINVNACTRITVIQARLIKEAASVQHPKWRCLSLYRILENAYLNNIKQLLLADFDADASRALDAARKKVSSELAQLVSLAEEADLTTEFETLSNQFDALIALGNRFIIMLDKGAEGDPLYGLPQAYKKGVLRFYKLRCSIAHAGTSSVIYEQFADADHAATALLPLIEQIALKSLKIAV